MGWQPFFYPVLNEAYAIEIALKWNTGDEFSGYLGFVTTFKLNTAYIEKFEVQNVGGKIHNELWIPSEELEIFNSNIQGKIEIVKTYIGNTFKGTKDPTIGKIIKTTLVNKL